MLTRLFLFLVAVLMAGSASAGPTVLRDSRAASELRYIVTFDATTTASETMAVRGLCVATFIRAGSETVTLYQTTASTATGGTSIATFSATTTSPTSLTIGQPNLYAVSDGATAGGSLTVHCSPLQVSSSGGGVLHPASGVDSELCLGENSDHGTDTYCLRIDATTDLATSRTETLGLMAQTGTRIERAFVDDAGHGEVRELVRWNNGIAAVGTPANANGGLLSGGTGVADTASFLNGGIAIGSATGGAIRATGLSIRTGFANSGNANRCDWQVQMVNTTGFQFDSTDKNDDAVTTACVGTIQMGFGSVNSGGVGDSAVSAAFSGYYLPMGGDCACATDDCFLAVSVSDRVPGSETCDAVNDVYVNLFVTEDPL